MGNEVVGAFYDEFSEGGLLNDVDVTIKTWRYRNWDYNGTVAPPVLGLQLEMVEDDGTVTVDVASAGDLKNFVPSEMPLGKKAVPVGQNKKMNKNTNAMLTVISLMQADTRGELAAKLRQSDDISILDGVKVHILRTPQPKRRNMPVIQAGPEAQPGAPQVQKREPEYISITKVIAYPWENGKAATTTAAAPVAQAATMAAPQAAAPAAGGNADIANTILLTLVAEAGGSIPKTQIAGKTFSNETHKALPPAVKNQVLGMLVSEPYLQMVGNVGLVYNPATGTIAFPQ